MIVYSLLDQESSDPFSQVTSGRLQEKAPDLPGLSAAHAGACLSLRDRKEIFAFSLSAKTLVWRPLNNLLSWFLPSTRWVPGIKLRSSDLVAGAFMEVAKATLNF